MAQNFVQAGEVIEVTAPSGGYTSGKGVLVGSIVGVALNTAAQNATCEVALCGVWTVDKAGSQAWSQGDKIYWDDTAKNFTTTSSGNTFAGYAFVAAQSADTTGQVKLVQ